MSGTTESSGLLSILENASPYKSTNGAANAGQWFRDRE